MANEKIEEKEKIQESNLKELIEVLNKLAPSFIEYHKIKAPEIERNQYINLTIMCVIIVSITLLAYFKIIDSSAATGLIGAIIGYVFGSLYHRK